MSSKRPEKSHFELSKVSPDPLALRVYSRVHQHFLQLGILLLTVFQQMSSKQPSILHQHFLSFHLLVCVWCGIYPLEFSQTFPGGQRQVLSMAGTHLPSSYSQTFSRHMGTGVGSRDWRLCVLLPPTRLFCFEEVTLCKNNGFSSSSLV